MDAARRKKISEQTAKPAIKGLPKTLPRNARHPFIQHLYNCLTKITMLVLTLSSSRFGMIFLSEKSCAKSSILDAADVFFGGPVAQRLELPAHNRSVLG